jgi:hypothetical protein
MIMGLPFYTAFHTALSLVALAAGVPVMLGLIRGKLPPAASMLYFATSVATDVTGFGFPFVRLLPSHIVGILSLIALAAALYARYGTAMTAGWRVVYAAGTTISVFFLAFVTVAQAFAKLPALHALAPTATERPFAAAEVVVLLVFVTLGVMAVRALRRGS